MTMVQLSDQFSSTPTALGISARLALRRLQSDRIDPRPFLKRSRVSLHDLTAKKRISAVAQIEFLNEVAAATKDEFIGMNLAESYDLRELGMLYYVTASSNTLHEALRRLTRYSRLGNEGIYGREKRGTACTIEFIFDGVQRFRDKQQIEFLAVSLVRLCRQMLGRKIVPDSTSFIHYRRDDERSLDAWLGSDIRFGATIDEMRFDPCLFDVPLVGQDPYLNELMSKACEEALAKRKVAVGPFRTTVENAIAPLLPHGEANLRVVSGYLGLSERTFQRRLVKENLRFADILEDMRRSLAVDYLAEPELQISQIAWLLGFSDPSAFTHSCRKWFGMSPTTYRKAVR